MPDIDRYRPEDRRAVDALYRRVFGTDAANASGLRWEWQYRRNPNNPGGTPVIFLTREGTNVVGQYATMPVGLLVMGADVDASWGMDVMIAPERQRQGLGEALFRTWDRHVGASLGLGLSASSYRLFKKLRWPDVGPVPCLVKPLTRRAFRRPQWSPLANRLLSAVTLPYVRIVSRTGPLKAQIEPIRHFDHAFDELWDRVGREYDFIVRRDAAYLNWKYIEAPHVRYSVVALRRDDKLIGYVVYRHVREPRGRVTLLVDFLVDPADKAGFVSLIRWVDREAREADSDKIRCFSMHAGFRRLMKHNGYFEASSTMDFCAKVNAVEVQPAFYRHTGKWHVTLGDSDQDR